MANQTHQHYHLWFCLVLCFLLSFVLGSKLEKHEHEQQQQQQQQGRHGEDEPRHPSIIQRAIEGKVSINSEDVGTHHVIPPRSFQDEETDGRGKTVRKDYGGSRVSSPAGRKGNRHSMEPIINRATALATIRPSASTLADKVVQQRSQPSFPANRGNFYPGRSIEDWELENFAIFIGVDGTIVAKDRKGGKEMWRLETEPLIQTTRHKPRTSEGLFEGPDPNEWVVEGRDGGQLFRMTEKGLERLEMSIKQLVDNYSPYSRQGHIYDGAKQTVFYSIDPRDGEILFSSDNPGGKDHSCKKKDFLDGLEDECRTRESFTVGKTVYTVKIMNHKELLWTIKYTEWGPAIQDLDLATQYTKSMDDKYFFSMHDGLMIGIDYTNDEKKPFFNHKFQSPIVSIFDIIRPSNTYSSDEPLVIVPHPPHSSYEHTKKNMVYLNRVGPSGYFAMSEKYYPGVTSRARAATISQDYSTDEDDDEDRVSSIIGVHPLRPNVPSSHKFSPPGLEAQAPGQDPTRSDPPPTATAATISADTSFRITYGRALDAGAALPWIFFILYLVYRYTPIAKFLLGKVKPQKALPAPDIKESIPIVPESVVEHAKSENDGDATPRKPLTVTFEEPTGDETPTPTPKKRGAHRGKRGRGSKNRARAEKAAAKRGEESGEQENSSEEKNDVGVAAVIHEPETLDSTAGKGVVADDLVVSDEIIGHGSHGTVVYKGSFEGREVAVKRMLLEFFDVASHEVTLLQESDDHPNVIRYHCKKQRNGFLYIALELCPASLQDLIDRPNSYEHIIKHMDPQDVLYQMTLGVQYLHSLKIVHRDLKPQNILVTNPKKNRKDNKLMPPRILISDFGLCKKLDADQSSFRATTAHAAGTSGWRAPELLVGEGDAPLSTSLDTSTTGSTSDSTVVDTLTNRRATRAIDIFSLGCVFYFILTKGCHPFGDRYLREGNIVNGAYNLDLLDGIGDAGAMEARDLIESMLRRNPRERPDATTVLMHPFFWSDEKKLAFLLDASDRFESENRDPPSPLLQFLEAGAPEVLGTDWTKRFDKAFLDEMGTHRKYNAKNMLDLLRGFRNKKHHYQDLSDHVQALVGPLPGGYLRYFTNRFPKLLLYTYGVVRDSQVREESVFEKYFTQ